MPDDRPKGPPDPNQVMHGDAGDLRRALMGQQQPYPQQPYVQQHPHAQQPYPQQQQHASPSPSASPSPYAQQPYPQQPYAQQAYAQQQPYAQQPYPPPHAAQLPAAQAVYTPRRTHLAQAVKPPRGTGAAAMAFLSLRRAFRLRIDANEVLDDERAAMLGSSPPITDDSQQAFLAWRRSVLFVAALLMIPVAIFHAIDNLDFDASTPEIWKQLSYVSVFVESGFAIFLWTQVGKWRAWRTQSRRLAWGWLIYFLTPFLVFLYPLASAFNYGDMDPASQHAAKVAVGMAIGAQAFLSLAPKIISLLQGLIRASIATKTLFPGSSAPGWMMVIAAPLYMIIFYIFVLLPYHFSGSGLVVLGMLLVLAAKATLVRAGLGLTKPMADDVARRATAKAQSLWLLLLVSGAACIVGGLWTMVSEASPLTLVNFALSMAANILLLTLIATDTLITALDRARGTTEDERRLADEAAAEVAAFTAERA